MERAKQDYLRSVPMGSDENKEIAFRQLAEICLDMGDPGEADAFLHCARRFGSNEELYEKIKKKIETARSRGFG